MKIPNWLVPAIAALVVTVALGAFKTYNDVQALQHQVEELFEIVGNEE